MSKQPVRTLIFDETLNVAERAKATLSRASARLTFAGSLSEFELAVKTCGTQELVLVNLSAEVSAWALAKQLRVMPAETRIVVLVRDMTDHRIETLRAAAHVETVNKPATVMLDDLLKRLIADATTSPAEGAAPLEHGLPGFHGIIGRSREMLRIFSLIDKVAPGDTNVCVYGESGTGKELIARAIHLASPRAHRPLVTLDCAAIPDGLMESQLFGHVKGAFTGAVDNREGVFALAHTGTLFMDELSELDLPLQAKLLRVIQNREFFKVGSSRPQTTNIRLISATNRDLKQEVDRGTFREDLYYRVGVIMVKVPPLRERREDIPVLVRHFLENFSKKHRKDIHGVAAGAMDRIVSSPWPGNIRQLQNFIEQAVVLTDSEILRERDLFLTEPPAARIAGTPLDMEPGLPLREVERQHILRTLTRVDGSRTQAAKMLGISLRALQYKLKAYMEEEARAEEARAKPSPTYGSRPGSAWIQQA